MDRRKFMASAITAGTALSVAATSAGGQETKAIRIIGISCSPRKGKTTATSVKVALDAAAGVDKNIKTEMIDLGGLNIAGWPGGESKTKDDLDSIISRLGEPDIGGLIIGSPSYFRSMSSLCKVFLERLAVLRSPNLLLADKALGALAVGAYRNGGQELVIDQIQTAMLCHEVMVVGGKPKAHQGATLWNAYKDDIMKDEFGINSAKQLGIRVAEAALRLA